MKYPTLSELNTSREMIDVFGGYNHNLRIGDGEFYDMKNLTSADYPVLSPRPQRGTYKSPTSPGGLIAKDALCYVDGETLYINEYPINYDTKMKLLSGCNTCPNRNTCTNYAKNKTICEKTLISMGAYIIIMPDKKYINTESKGDDGEYDDYGDIEATFTTNSKTYFDVCKVDGTLYDNITKSATAPEITDDMKADERKIPLWLDTSKIPNSLKQYSTTNNTWSPVTTTYIKIASTGIGTHFNKEDGVIISGILSEEIAFLNTSTVIWEKGDDYIVVKGYLDQAFGQDDPITVKRQMPNMDFIIESGNRLWGCRYGVAHNGEVVNEIYASKLGDFKNWNCFMSISTDSYVASVGSDGQFTGAITHLGYPIFFKENCLHKVYGNYPSNYQIQTTACRGVQKGSGKSLAIVNETLFYKSRSAVCSYDGSLPVEVSSALGEVSYGDAVAGVLGNKYYISMKDSEGQYHLFVFDTQKGMWHREDNTQAMAFCNCRGNLYYIDYDDNKIKTVRPPATELEGKVDTKAIEWQAITGVMGTDSPDKKYISRLVARMSLEIGTTIVFYVEYDSSGEWEHLFTMSGTSLRSFSVPIRPKRCDHLRLRIDGKGAAKIYSICKTIEQGSDV